MTIDGTGELSCVAINIAKAGHEDEVRAAHERLSAPVSLEQGFIQYDLHQDVNDPRRFVLFERWSSRADFEAHCIAPHIKDFLAETADLLESGVFYPLVRIT